MYGVPANLPLHRFIGDYMGQICVGMDGIHFVFGKSGTISVEGRWELTDSDGKIIDCACDYTEREAYRIHALFNQDVTEYAIDPPRSFSLTFASGHRLTVYDDTPQYESFHISPDGIIV